MHECPACGRSIPTGMFLCLPCADRTPDSLIDQIGGALDSGDTDMADVVLTEAVSLLNEE